MKISTRSVAKQEKSDEKDGKQQAQPGQGKEGKADLSAEIIRNLPGGRVFKKRSMGGKDRNYKKMNRNGNERNRREMTEYKKRKIKARKKTMLLFVYLPKVKLNDQAQRRMFD